MNLEALKLLQYALTQLPVFVGIKSDAEHAQALRIMESLIEDYDANRLLIELLSASIETWENHSPEFAEFNARISSLESGLPR